MARELVRRDIVPEIAALCALRQQVSDEVAELLLRSGDVLTSMFVEGLLLGDVADVNDVGRFAPGAAVSAISGQDLDRLLAPAVGLVLLVLYAAAATVAGSLATSRRDVA